MKGFKKQLALLIGPYSKYILYLYFFKPFICTLVACCLKVHLGRTYYSTRLFIIRLSYDFALIILPAYLFYIEREYPLKIFFKLMVPLAIIEFMLFLFNVYPSFKTYQKVKFRLLREEITTQEQNDAMYSTEEEE